jgi:hypothetical protein
VELACPFQPRAQTTLRYFSVYSYDDSQPQPSIFHEARPQSRVEQVGG